jgi:hypothetical protein
VKTSVHFWSFLAQFFLEREMLQTKVVEKIKTYILFSIIFFILLLWDIVEKYCRASQTVCGNVVRAHAHAMPGTWAYKNTLMMCNTYCCSSATMVAQMRLVIRTLSILVCHDDSFYWEVKTSGLYILKVFLMCCSHWSTILCGGVDNRCTRCPKVCFTEVVMYLTSYFRSVLYLQHLAALWLHKLLFLSAVALLIGGWLYVKQCLLGTRVWSWWIVMTSCMYTWAYCKKEAFLYLRTALAYFSGWRRGAYTDVRMWCFVLRSCLVEMLWFWHFAGWFLCSLVRYSSFAAAGGEGNTSEWL